MSGEIVHSLCGVTLLGGSPVKPQDVYEALTLAPTLVCADGGGDVALELGLAPEAVIGDLDSLSGAGRAALGARVHHIPEQDSTDFGKCLAHVRAPFFLALGFAGRRLDHTLAAMTDLIREPRPVVMLAEHEVIFRAPPEIALDLAPGTRVSVCPFGPVTGRSEGLRWPLDGVALDPATRVGTSNEATGPVRLALSGPALLLLPRRLLPDVLGVLVPR